MTRMMPLLVAGLCLVGPANAVAHDGDARQRRGDAVIASLNNGQPQPALEQMARDFPELAAATRAYALGEAWSGTALGPRERQLAAVAAFAATGQQPFVRIHAGYALNVGVSEEELREVVMLTTVTAGFARAIETSQTLAALFAERRTMRGRSSPR